MARSPPLLAVGVVFSSMCVTINITKVCDALQCARIVIYFPQFFIIHVMFNLIVEFDTEGHRCTRSVIHQVSDTSGH